MGTLHVRGMVQHGLPPLGAVNAGRVKIWDAAGLDPATPVFEGDINNGDFDGFAGIRNISGPSRDGSGHFKDVVTTVLGVTVTTQVWVPDQEEIPHIPLLQIKVIEGDLHTPDFPVALPYVAPPDDSRPPTPVVVPWPGAPVCLPQDDPLPIGRAAAVEIVKGFYPWQEVRSFPGAEDVVFDPPLAMAGSVLPLGVPVPELPLPGYMERRAVLEAQIQANRLVNDAAVDSISDISDYEDLYHTLPRPAVIETWTSDEKFASQRLAGVNPAMLRKISRIPPRFGVEQPENEAILSTMIGEPLADALAAGRLYLLDYAILEGIREAHDAQDGRHLPAPYALFYACPCDDDAPHTVEKDDKVWTVETGRKIDRKAGLTQRERSHNLRRWADVMKASALAKAADLKRRATRDPKATAEHEANRKHVADLTRFAEQLGAAESALNDKLREVHETTGKGKAAYAGTRESMAQGLRHRAFAGRELSTILGTSVLELGLSGPLCNPGQELVPVAIQIERDYDPATNPVLTPVGMKEEWDVAKMMVQVADLNAHEMRTHLWGAHFAMEPFAVAMNRQLAPNHPLLHLLQPHFYALIFNNHLGVGALINPGGGVDKLLGTRLSGSIEVLRRARDEWSFEKANLEQDLRERGLDNPDTSLKDYPYRDDAKLVCAAIESFVAEYSGIYYAADSAVNGDWELQAWLQEVRDKHVAGVPEVRTLAALREFLTQLIFTSSAYHAAVNFTQYDFMAFAPNMPGAAFADPVDRSHGVMWFLPPAHQAKEQLDLVSELSQFQWDKLGDYQSPFTDSLARDAAGRFQQRLADVRAEIDQRNQARRESLRYPYLDPSRIPNSTSV